MKNLKIVIISQEDSFTIPENISLISSMEFINIFSVINLKTNGSVINKKKLFFEGFGFFQSFKIGIIICWNLILDFIDLLFNYKLNLKKSLKGISKFIKANYLCTDNVNSKTFIKYLKKNRIDLVVSFSAPCVFSPELLNVPTYGCINLHCSLLPRYSGLLPSFWVLYENELSIGATVHRMDDNIDNGKILGQVELPLPKNLTMFNVINSTKKNGGILMTRVIKELQYDMLKETDNNLNPNFYRSWPTVSQIHKFRISGGRLI